MSMIMDKSDPENPRANEKRYINQDVDLNDLLRTFSDDPNNEVKTFTCSPYIDIEGLTPLSSRYIPIYSVIRTKITNNLKK